VLWRQQPGNQALNRHRDAPQAVRAAAEPIDSSGHDVDERVWCAGKHQRVAALKLYQELGFPALQKGGQDKKLVGYFQADTGTINQLVHLWRFDDDRRSHWAAVYANKDFVEGFASKFRPLLMTQEVKLLQAAP
jgi:hypothetical protein